jgi:hypothetical protein
MPEFASSIPFAPPAATVPVPSILHTLGGLIQGTLHVPTLRDPQAFLDGCGDILRLTDVRLRGTNEAFPFLAFQKSAVLLILPMGETYGQDLDPSRVPGLEVTCLLTRGRVHGELDVPAGMRTSDFLQRNRGFLELRNGRIGPGFRVNADSVGEVAMGRILVNAHNLIGITDEAEARAYSWT